MLAFYHHKRTMSKHSCSFSIKIQDPITLYKVKHTLSGVFLLLLFLKHAGWHTAQIFWLKNRRPDKWRDKREEAPQQTNELLQSLLDLERGRA